MPYRLAHSGSSWTLTLWPYNALGPRGFAAVIIGAAAILALPLLAVLGSAALWGLLPFELAALAALWVALRRNWADRNLCEEMHLARNGIYLRRVEPTGEVREWRANPAWVTLRLYTKGGPVPNYLTLTGGGREVELGAFLSEAERLQLYAELDSLLLRLKSYA